MIVVPASKREMWERLVQRYADISRDLPVNSCSVAGNVRAEAFARFAAPHLRGRVLDIGCGVQPVSIYVADYPARYLSGIDPLAPPDRPHAFLDFEVGTAESLPWPNGQFETAIFATSLDHVWSPAIAIREAARVLAPDGRLLVWETCMPAGEDGPDDHHAFRFTRLTLFALLAPYFIPIDAEWHGEWGGDGAQDHFGAWGKK